MKIAVAAAVIASVVFMALSEFTFNHNNKKNIESEIDLLLFYGSFDRDHDGYLYVTEINDLFEWCQTEIEYNAHEGYQSPLETVQKKSGDCLDISLLIAHCLKMYFGNEPLIGGIAWNNGGDNVNHACCLLPLSPEMKGIMSEELGHSVSYFRCQEESVCLVIIDPLCCRDLGILNVEKYYLIRIRTLEDYPFEDMPITSTTR